MTARQPRTSYATCPCGWQGTGPTTAALAAAALAKHNCESYLRRQAGTARRLARLQEGGTERPCTHATHHPHGAYARYTLDRCRCRPCRDANRFHNRDLERAHLYGRQAYIDAEPARRHVLELTRQGMGRRKIAKASGVSRNTLRALTTGGGTPSGKPSRRILRANAEALLALHLELAGGALVDPAGTARRIQALHCLGWTIPQLMTASGLGRACFERPLAGHQTTAGTARAITTLYDRYWATTPPTDNHWQLAAATRTKALAGRNGWAPPLAWDDDTIDDPTAVPQHQVPDEPGGGVDEAAILRRLGGDRSIRLTRAERWALVRRLHAQGLNDQQISARAGMWDKQVLRDRQTLGLAANFTNGRADVA